MEISLAVQYDGAVPGANLKRRDWVRLLKAGWEEVGRYWLRHLLPKHFTKAGEREYRYAPRQGETAGSGGKSFWRSYTGQKQLRKGHTLPLVFSGELRDRADEGARVKALPVGRGVRVIMPGARKANLLMAPSSKINMAKELRTVSAAEEELLARVFDSWIARRLRSYSKRTRVRA